MLKKFTLLLIFAISLASSNSFATADPKAILPIQHWVTSKGARVYFVPSSHELPILDVQIVFDAGSSRDGSQFGLAAFTNSMIDQGTSHLTADQIATDVDNNGILLSSQVDSDKASISFRCLTKPEVLNTTLQLITDILHQPSFPEKEFLLYKKQTLSKLQELEQSPSYLAKRAFYQTIYGQHPYGHPIFGTQTSLATISQQDLSFFYQKYYVVRNATISIVGNIDRKKAQEIAEKITLSLPQGQPAVTLPLASPLHQEVVLHVTYPSTQTHIQIGQVGISPNAPDYFPLMVGNYILGGGSFVSRLTEEVREKEGYAYSISSVLLPLIDRGPFFIVLQTKTDQAMQAKKMVLHVLEKFIHDGPTEKELTDAKKSLINQFPLHFADNESMTETLAMIGFYHRPLNYLDRYRNNITAVTTTQVRDAFQRHFDPKTLAIITVGNETKN